MVVIGLVELDMYKFSHNLIWRCGQKVTWLFGWGSFTYVITLPNLVDINLVKVEIICFQFGTRSYVGHVIKWLCGLFYLPCDLLIHVIKEPCDIFKGALHVSHHFARFGGHFAYRNWVIMCLLCQVNSKDHVLKGSCGFMNGSSSL